MVIFDLVNFLNYLKSEAAYRKQCATTNAALPHTAGECVACAACEKRCPFHVAVVENMRLAAKVFGK